MFTLCVLLEIASGAGRCNCKTNAGVEAPILGRPGLLDGSVIPRAQQKAQTRTMHFTYSVNAYVFTTSYYAFPRLRIVLYIWSHIHTCSSTSGLSELTSWGINVYTHVWHMCVAPFLKMAGKLISQEHSQTVYVHYVYAFFVASLLPACSAHFSQWWEYFATGRRSDASHRPPGVECLVLGHIGDTHTQSRTVVMICRRCFVLSQKSYKRWPYNTLCYSNCNVRFSQTAHHVKDMRVIVLAPWLY
jgi:hypothetical protein